MSESLLTFRAAGGWLNRHRGLLLPLGAAALILVILAPLPPVVIDVLLAANIALAAIILLTTIFAASPMDFSVFPTVLLGATLLRLVLNVATTRLILTAGADGRSAAEARLAAGKVIWAFSDFVASGSLAVGVILFAIIVVIQFIVITKGAGRISEVAARFVLDAMPGRQMAIDADRKAGAIDDDEARRRREEIARQADFYGAMDGASKFVRGDAVAAVVITLVNILGGLYVGLVSYGWSWDQTVNLFTRLTLGDGLVTQVPAFIVSVSAALLITRSTARTNLGEQVVSQLTARPAALAITAGFLAVLALTSLPKAPLLVLGAAFGGLAWLLGRKEEHARTDDNEPPDTSDATPPVAPSDLTSTLTVDPVRLEIGFALVPLVEPPTGPDLLGRIAALRRELAERIGLVLPPIRIRDNMRLASHEYAVLVRGTRAASGRLYPTCCLALGVHAAGRLEGREVDAEVLGSPAVWIDPERRETAERMHYRVLDPAAVLLIHLGRTIQSRAADLLSREQVARLLDVLDRDHPHLVSEARDRLGLSRIHKVLQGLLKERVPIRDLETILEAACDASDRGESVEGLTAAARDALGPALCQGAVGEDGVLWCVCLPEELERRVADFLADSDGPSGAGLPGDLADLLGESVRDGLIHLRRQGRRPVVLCAPSVRSAVREAVAAAAPDAAVLGYNDVNDVRVSPVTEMGTNS